MIPSGDVWIRRMIEVERTRRVELARQQREAGLARPGKPARRALRRPRNRGA